MKNKISGRNLLCIRNGKFLIFSPPPLSIQKLKSQRDEEWAFH